MLTSPPESVRAHIHGLFAEEQYMLAQQQMLLSQIQSSKTRRTHRLIS